jgi:hypothetical protein
MLQIKVPYLTPTQLDQVVAELLRNYGKWRGAPVRPPIDVDEIAEGYLGLTLELIVYSLGNSQPPKRNSPHATPRVEPESVLQEDFARRHGAV